MTRRHHGSAGGSTFSRFRSTTVGMVSVNSLSGSAGAYQSLIQKQQASANAAFGSDDGGKSMESNAAAYSLYNKPGLLTGLTHWDGSTKSASQRAAATATSDTGKGVKPKYSFNPFDRKTLGRQARRREVDRGRSDKTATPPRAGWHEDRDRQSDRGADVFVQPVRPEDLGRQGAQGQQRRRARLIGDAHRDLPQLAYRFRQQPRDREHSEDAGDEQRLAQAEHGAEHTTEQRADRHRSPHHEPHRRVHAALHAIGRDGLAQAHLIDVVEHAAESEQHVRGDEPHESVRRRREPEQSKPIALISHPDRDRRAREVSARVMRPGGERGGQYRRCC